MTFHSGDPTGMAVLVPCRQEIMSVDDLVAEAQALWRAESPAARSGAIGGDWGCVGALFGNDEAHKLLSRGWSAYFRKVRKSGISVVDSNGLLSVPFPTGTNGALVPVDAVLATATRPEELPPGADSVADAWISQDSDHERYFMENVRHGIRTDADLDIWRRIEKSAPAWLGADKNNEAKTLLRAEIQRLSQSSAET
jgi:hypothetical protein